MQERENYERYNAMERKNKEHGSMDKEKISALSADS